MAALTMHRIASTTYRALQRGVNALASRLPHSFGSRTVTKGNRAIELKYNPVVLGSKRNIVRERGSNTLLREALNPSKLDRNENKSAGNRAPRFIVSQIQKLSPASTKLTEDEIKRFNAQLYIARDLENDIGILGEESIYRIKDLLAEEFPSLDDDIKSDIQAIVALQKRTAEIANDLGRGYFEVDLEDIRKELSEISDRMERYDKKAVLVRELLRPASEKWMAYKKAVGAAEKFGKTGGLLEDARKHIRAVEVARHEYRKLVEQDELHFMEVGGFALRLEEEKLALTSGKIASFIEAHQDAEVLIKEMKEALIATAEAAKM